MVKAATALLLLAVCVGIAAADAPQQSYGTPGVGYREDPLVPDRCQYGFQDDLPGQGWSLYYGQQLGIHCPGPITISGVGFYCEFIASAGNLDIVIYDGGTEVQRTSVTPVAGENNFDLPDIDVSDACIMLCPTTFDGVTGEDYSNSPFGNTYWSTTCGCSNPFTDNNLTIWADLGGTTPADPQTWGTLKLLYR